MTSVYWPGTKIVKSRGNAFDWRTDPRSQIFGSRDFKVSESAKRSTKGTGSDPRKQFTIYSRAHPSA